MMRRVISLVIRAALLLALIPLVLVPVYAFVNPVSTVMLARWVTGQPVIREWRPLTAISPNLVRAVIAAEDARFCSHHGVDWVEVNHAIGDAEDFSDLRGASTIPMQTAKNLFLWPGRQYIRKALEVPIAYYMSLVWTKRRLLEIYLNVAEWGPNGEFGVEAGARRAFRKSARSLTVGEAALLAAVLPNPRGRNAGRPSRSLLRTAARYRRVAATPGAALTLCLARR